MQKWTRRDRYAAEWVKLSIIDQSFSVALKIKKIWYLSRIRHKVFRLHTVWFELGKWKILST